MDYLEVLEKTRAGKRISSEEACLLFRTAPLLQLAETANYLTRKRHPDPIVTYIVDRNINYTNICISQCRFCAFYRPPDHPEGYVLDWPTLEKKIAETRARDGIQILLQGGLHPNLDITYFEEILRLIKRYFPDINIHGLSPPEIIHISRQSGLTISQTLIRLKEAGLGSIPGGGAEILSDRVRGLISPRKCSSQEWLLVMEEAHKLGLKTTATMMYGHIETSEERIEHLIKLRRLQDRTGGFTAFIPWSFQHPNTALGSKKSSYAFDYLKTLALARIVLDNFMNIQASWVTQGPKIAQIALFFGANDLGSTMLEENVVRATGVSFSLTEADLQRLITDIGFIPQRRNTFYELISKG
jgi:cyclic dehypoxanthinyl futalosine synthase